MSGGEGEAAVAVVAEGLRRDTGETDALALSTVTAALLSSPRSRPEGSGGGGEGFTRSLVQGDMVHSGRGGGTGGVRPAPAAAAAAEGSEDGGCSAPVLTAIPGLRTPREELETGGRETVAWMASSPSSAAAAAAGLRRIGGGRGGCRGGALPSPLAGRAGALEATSAWRGWWRRPRPSCMSVAAAALVRPRTKARGESAEHFGGEEGAEKRGLQRERNE